MALFRLRLEEAPSKKGSCEYIEYAAADSGQGVVLPALGLGVLLTIPRLKNKHVTNKSLGLERNGVVSQNRNKWKAFVSLAMKLSVP
jgi:hypothetical protein